MRSVLTAAARQTPFRQPPLLSRHSARSRTVFSRPSSQTTMRPLTTDILNPAIRNVEYAVRGELALKAEFYRELLKKPDHGLPFNKVISSNIGNPQQKGLDQKPLTFSRQVCLEFLFLSLSFRQRALTSYTGGCVDRVSRTVQYRCVFIPERRSREGQRALGRNWIYRCLYAQSRRTAHSTTCFGIHL